LVSVFFFDVAEQSGRGAGNEAQNRTGNIALRAIKIVSSIRVEIEPKSWREPIGEGKPLAATWQGTWGLSTLERYVGLLAHHAAFQHLANAV
jgi:hypothetical protein